VSLALSGGGVAGSLFEFGALAALEAGLPGWMGSRSERIVGTSAGAVTGAVTAFGIDPDDVALALLGSSKHPLRFGRRDFFGLPFGESSPVLSGAFTNAGVERFIQRVAAYAGRADRFASLLAPLAVTATDLDAGERAVFGPQGANLPTVSRAVRASSAIPGTFRPVRIGDRDYIDGQIVDPLHLDLSVSGATRAVLAISSLVPYRRGPKGPRVTALRAPAILDQGGRVSATVKLARSLAALREARPEVRVFLVEPLPAEVVVLLRTGFDRTSFRAAWEMGVLAVLRLVVERRRELLTALGPLGIGVDPDALVARARRHRFDPDPSLVVG
jgi:predicted acylesterase/phospholipase RssA